MDGGDDTFYTFAFLTRVLKKRRDISGFDRGGIVFPGLYGGDFRDLSRDEKETRRHQVEKAALRAGRPVCYSTMNEAILPGVGLKQNGILYSAQDGPDRDRALLSVYDLRGVAPWHDFSAKRAPDYRTRALLPFYSYQRSISLARSGDYREASHFSESAYANGPDVLWLIPNLKHNAYRWAHALFESGKPDLAERFYRSIVRWDPQAAEAWADIGTILERRGESADAIAAYKHSIAIDPRNETVHFNLAVAYWKQNDWMNVVSALTHVLNLNPNHRQAQMYLAWAHQKLEKQ
jgi:tetratricopeptide (TPR) repeat protein